MMLCWSVARPSVASHTSLDHTPFDPSVKTTDIDDAVDNGIGHHEDHSSISFPEPCRQDPGT